MVESTSRAKITRLDEDGTDDGNDWPAHQRQMVNRIDELLGGKTCTSTTRPSASDRFIGMTIFETDTKTVRIFDGTNWVWVGGDPVKFSAPLNASTPTPAHPAFNVLQWGAGVARQLKGGFAAPVNDRRFRIPEAGQYMFNGLLYMTGVTSEHVVSLRLLRYPDSTGSESANEELQAFYRPAASFDTAYPIMVERGFSGGEYIGVGVARSAGTATPTVYAQNQDRGPATWITITKVA